MYMTAINFYLHQNDKYCFHRIFGNLEIYWYESNTLLNTFYCFFFFQCSLSPDSFWRHDGKFWVISEDLKWLGSKYNNRCWKISLIMIVDFLKKLFIRTWTNWAYFLKGPFWLVCRELFKWTSFQKNLVFFED